MPEKSARTTVQLAEAHQGYYEYNKTADGAKKCGFIYYFNSQQMEKLETDKFAVKTQPTGTAANGWIEETQCFMMHTIWLTESNSLSRWYEWFMTVQTQTKITTGETKPVPVIPTEITGPACKNCLMSISHSGTLSLYEERLQDGATYWLNKPMKYADDCDWGKLRGDGAFSSLQGGICLGIKLDDTASKRLFHLEKLSFGYKGSDNIMRRINHPAGVIFEAATNKKSAYLGYVKWNTVYNMLTIRIDLLAIGSVTKLRYQAQVRLCAL